MLYLNNTPLEIKRSLGFWASAPDHSAFFKNILDKCHVHKWAPLIKEAKLQARDLNCVCPTFYKEEDLIQFIHFLEKKINSPFIKITYICK